MSKNLTRKGLALGALLALGSSVIAGAPAQAAGELVVAPSAGTSYNAVAGSVYNLTTTFAPGYTPSSYAQLKYIVKTDANAGVTYDVGVAAVTAPATSQAVSLSSSAVAATGASAVTVNYLGLKTNDATVTSAVEVTAFVDANNDGAVTAGEWNAVKTVTFKKLADITPVVTLTQPSTGDTTVSATVAWGDLNVEQASAASTYLTVAGSTNSSLGVEFNIAAAGYPAAAATGVSYASSTGKYSKTVSALASAASVAARAVYATNTYVNPTDTYTSTALGSAVSANATVRTINTTNGLVANVLAGNDSVATAETIIRNDANSAAAVTASRAAVVRTNGSFTAQVKAYDTTAGTALAAPSVAVVGAVTGTFATALRPASTGVTEISVTVAGQKYTTNATLAAATFALTTDASGLASLAISSTGLAAADSIKVVFSAQNLTATVYAVQTDATYTVTDDGASAVIATDKNTATTLNYSVKDQFGVLSARTNERLLVSATQTGATIANQFIAVSAGKASFSITPGTDITADITVSAALQISATNATTGVTSWTADGTNVTPNRTVKVRSAAYSFTTAPAIDATTGINGGAWTAAGAQKQSLTLADHTATTNTGYVAPAAGTTYALVTLTGSNAGEKLTVSGTGVYLSIDGATPTANTATKVAQAAAVSIYVASNTTGAKTLTITNGSVSATVVVTFDAAVTATAGTLANKATISVVGAPATAQSGSSFDVKAVVADKYGNPLSGFAVKFSVTGSASLNGALSSTGTTDANGQVSVKLTSGVADSGNAVVTVVDNTNGRATADLLVAATATIAVSDLAKAAADKAAADAAAAAKAAADKAAADAAAAAKAAADAAAAVEAAAKAKTVTLTVPATTSQAGRALDVSVKVLNTAGAATAGRTVTFKSTGVGYLASTSAVTDANGVATVKLIAGNGDIGTSTVTATVDGVTTAASSVEFGVTDADVTVGGRAIYASVEFAKGKTVTVTIDGKRLYSKLQATDAYTELKFTQKTAGKHVVTIRVSGGTSVSETVVTTN